MDYIKESTTFKIKKLLRYSRMFGLAETHIKVRAQVHLNKTYSAVTRRGGSQAFTDQQSVGLIGCGNYAFSKIAHSLSQGVGKVIRVCMDIDPSRARSLSDYYGIPSYTISADDVFEDSRVKLIYVSSNHASHAEYAVRALQAGKDVYIEKPHVVSRVQLEMLVQAMKANTGRVFLGFNRPGSRFGELVKAHLDRETGPGMYNWFVAGHKIDPDHWYFRKEEGGRVLGNLCHWTDFLLYLMGSQGFPVRVKPTRARLSDTDIVATFTFADGSIGVISFSAKGHSFEGVREHLCCHKDNCIIYMSDYKTLSVDVGAKKYRFYNVFRDHGHRKNIIGAYDESQGSGVGSFHRDVERVWNSAQLFLETKRALEEDREIVVKAFSEEQLVASMEGIEPHPAGQ